VGRERIDRDGGATIAFLASGIEGLKVRLTAKAPTDAAVDGLLDDGERRVRAILGDALIFGIDDQSMESVVLDRCRQLGRSLGVAESLTGGLIGARLTAVPGASDVFRGSIVTYTSDLKRSLLGVADGPVVSEAAVVAMAEGAARVLGADVTVAATGVAGPASQDGEEPGTVWLATLVDGQVEPFRIRYRYDRERVRQFSVITVLNALRLRLC
jgi:nicotinamide-nucleotide amidase